MNPRTIWIVFTKEILDIIRDRRTLIFMIIMPLVAIPLLLNLMTSFMVGSAKSIAEKDSRVAVIGAESAPQLMNYLQNEQRKKSDLSDDPLQVDSMSEPNAFLKLQTDVADVEQADALIRDKKLDAAIKIPSGFEQDLETKTTSPAVEVRYLSTNDRSEKAFGRLRNSLRFYHERLVLERLNDQENALSEQGLEAVAPEVLIKPFETKQEDIAEAREKAGEVFGRILPYLIILMTFGGAIFPAISLAAGEKEQKTLETLLASPAARTELVTGKFLVIVLTGIVSAVLALVGLYYGMTFSETGGRLKEVFDVHVDLMSVVLTILLVVPLAVLFAGLLLSISVFARSFREAQGYMTPLNILIILPAFTSFLPGIELNYTLSMVPVMNVSLVLKEVLAGNIDKVLPFYAMTFVSTLVIAFLSILLCAWMFKNENAIFKV
jgi:sodium transport system permease protein